MTPILHKSVCELILSNGSKVQRLLTRSHSSPTRMYSFEKTPRGPRLRTILSACGRQAGKEGRAIKGFGITEGSRPIQDFDHTPLKLLFQDGRNHCLRHVLLQLSFG